MAKNHAVKNRGMPRSTYNLAYSCFSCRKTFKHPYFEGQDKRPCAECKQESFNMGRKFRSPPKENKLEWKIIEYITRKSKWGNFHTADRKSPALTFVERIEQEKIHREQLLRDQELELKRKRAIRKKKADVSRKMPIPGNLKK